MVRRKVEGDENERRKKAREARRSGSSPSAEHATTGGSKQPESLPKQDPHHHPERLRNIHKGKQGGKQQQVESEPKPGYEGGKTRGRRGD